MIEIGKNLKYEKLEFVELADSTLLLKNASHKIQNIDIDQIKNIELVGVKSNTGYCGTLESGMSNPTFILPTNFFYNIINVFKRKNDTVHIKVDLKNGSEFIVIGELKLYTVLQKLLNQQ